MRYPSHTHRPTSSAPRGFSLIELIVVIVIALTVTGLALGALQTSLRVQRGAEITNQLLRDMRLAVDLMSYDMSFAGVGVPRGLAKDTVIGTSPAAQLRPLVRYGTTTALALVGDLPYPNAELNGVMTIAGLASGNNHRLLVASEVCTCPPPASSGLLSYCNCRESTMTGISFAAGENCWGGEEERPSCPWAQNKWQRDSSGQAHMVIGTVDGGWRVRKWLADFSNSDSFRTSGDARTLHLYHDYPSAGAHTMVANEITGGASGTAWISNPDRVFWSQEGNHLYRRQCWGAVYSGGNGPDDADWPAVGASPLTTADTPLFCGAGDGTPWELVASNVESFELRYFKQPSGSGSNGEQSTPLDAAGASRTRVIEVDMTLAKRVPGSEIVVRQRALRRYWMENRGGLATTPATPVASGGCEDIDCRVD